MFVVIHTKIVAALCGFAALRETNKLSQRRKGAKTSCELKLYALKNLEKE
jgi:hypothetical protein